ncbi:Protein of unknown function (DUF989) [Spongiibacter sp. IMCC21906]|jgi:uncharacterized membrane protein|uniref:urate hydroxylase PuuD n=1 Tax=Spongiibacter sp. IMCC21906 TaxID=1620392 RepID=UPI00062DFCE0|nr:urate hydroxylase PuuD [Spongiibacter sp. IMCC21906]AKH68955.1 Protein of unknown function (DUF989) [Spongiibacter sp. IMCC21906]
MDAYISIDLLLRWLHVLFGVTWIGLLYYFNFVQTEYFKEAEANAKADAVRKLAPRALWWFRWGAMFTFLTGFAMLHFVAQRGLNAYIIIGALMGTLMFLNVWLIIWPNQKIVCGIKAGDASKAAPKAGLASRTNTLFSAPMLIGMMGSFHGSGNAASAVIGGGAEGLNISNGLWACIAIIILLELNALFGKTGPMTTVVGVVHCSIALAAGMLALLQFV